MTWTAIVMALATLATAVGIYLNQRQKRAVREHRHAVPARFAEAIPLAAHQKAADYTAAKLTVADLAGIWGLLLLFGWTIGGGLSLLDQWVAAIGLSPVWGGVAFLMLFFLAGLLLDMPLEAYSTFNVEARFGFNKMTPALYLSDMAKQMLLMAVIGAPVAWVILTLMASAGSLWWLYAWLFWTGFMLLMIWAYPTFIAPLFNKFEPLPDGEMKERIEALLGRCGFKSNGLFVMDGSRRSSHGNAYFTGLGNAKRIVFFDTLLKQLEPLETEAVLAHELGHFHHGHVKKRMAIMILTTLAGFAALGWLAAQPWFYTGLGVATPSNHAALVLFLLIAPAFTFVMTPLSSYFSRRHEFEADAYTVANSNGEALASALVGMYEDNASTLTPDPLYSAWHDSPPPPRSASITLSRSWRSRPKKRSFIRQFIGK